MSGLAPFFDGQSVDAGRYDATNPKWNHMGICIVVGQRRARCESGWMVNIMSKDGVSMELDSHWLSAENEPLAGPTATGGSAEGVVEKKCPKCGAAMDDMGTDYPYWLCSECCHYISPQERANAPLTDRRNATPSDGRPNDRSERRVVGAKAAQ